MPPGFDAPLPVGATVRYGQADRRRASVLVTLERDPAEVLEEITRALRARGWAVEAVASRRAREPTEWREVLEGTEVRVLIERGVAGITRTRVSQRRPGEPFHAPEEPLAWRRVARAPRPALSGVTSSACAAALRGACADWARAGGPDALDCGMDHRGACVLPPEGAHLGPVLDDARARLAAALQAHARVGSRGARADTRAQLHVEWLAAAAHLRAAAAVGAEDPALAALLEGASAEGHAVEMDVASWFAAPAADEP